MKAELNGHVVGIILKELVRRAMTTIRNERQVFEATAKQSPLPPRLQHQVVTQRRTPYRAAALMLCCLASQEDARMVRKSGAKCP